MSEQHSAMRNELDEIHHWLVVIASKLGVQFSEEEPGETVAHGYRKLRMAIDEKLEKANVVSSPRFDSRGRQLAADLEAAMKDPENHGALAMEIVYLRKRVDWSPRLSDIGLFHTVQRLTRHFSRFTQGAGRKSDTLLVRQVLALSTRVISSPYAPAGTNIMLPQANGADNHQKARNRSTTR